MTMYQVMLLDDEPWELKGLKNMIPWEEYGFTVSETLSNPLEALERLKTRPIDVLISDIRMPGLSGIELLKQLRPLYPDMEILFLSGYAEFEYARNALRLGAFDYLLKPLDLDTVGELLTRLSNRIAEKHMESERKIFEKISDGDLTLAELFGDDEISNRGSITDCISGGSIRNSTPGYLAIHSSTDLSDFLSGQPDISFRSIKSGTRQYLYFVRCHEEQGLVSQLKITFPDLQAGISLLYQKDDGPSNVGVPTLLIRQSLEAFYLPFVTGRTEPNVYCGMNLPALKELIGKNGKGPGIEFSAHEFSIARDLPEYIRTHTVNLTGLVWFWNQMLIRLADRPDLYEEHCILDINQLLERFSTLEQLCQDLAALLDEDSPSLKVPVTDMGGSELYHSMIEYVNTHYQEPITLQDVADHLHVSFAYASKLFKKYTDTNYSKYLTGLRLDEAQKLLSTTEKTVEEICYEIGYNDYFYFNKTFKKYSGVTPLQYRRQVKNL